VQRELPKPDNDSGMQKYLYLVSMASASLMMAELRNKSASMDSLNADTSASPFTKNKWTWNGKGDFRLVTFKVCLSFQNFFAMPC
jgi:hypothetical protein